jgi:hypothetical protein
MRATYGYAGHTLFALVWSLATSAAHAQASAPPTAAGESGSGIIPGDRPQPPQAASAEPAAAAAPSAAATAPQADPAQAPAASEHHASRRVHRRRHNSWILMAAGLTVFGISYLSPAILGISLANEHGCIGCDVYYRLLIPVAGPLTFVKSAHGHGETTLVNAGLFAISLVQIAGLILSVIGIMRFANRNEGEAPPEAPLTFGIAPTLGGASGVLRLRM